MAVRERDAALCGATVVVKPVPPPVRLPNADQQQRGVRRRRPLLPACLKRRAVRRRLRAVTDGRTAALKLANSISRKNFFNVVRRAVLTTVTPIVCFSML